MGASCCIAARKKPISDQTTCSVNLGCSPPWRLHDSQTHPNDTCDNPLFQGNYDNSALEVSNYIHTRDNDYPDGGNSSCSDQSPNWGKPHIVGRVDGNVSIGKAGQGTGSNMPIMEKDLDSSSAGSTSAHPEQLIPLHSSPSSSAYRIKTLSPSSSVPSGPASLRKTRHSFGYRIYKQISDSRIVRSLREPDPPERRKPLVLSAHNDDSSAGGSCGGSSDHWSLRLFSELVASSQRDQLSFDSEKPSNGHHCWSPANCQKCGICLKTLNERPPWSSQNFGRASEVPVVSVLFCGHTYHAECLENQTLEMDKYDPPCPVCTSACKQGASSSKKAATKARNKHSRSAVGDFDLDSSIDFEQRKCMEYDEKVVKRSFSLKSSFTRRFWRSHFLTGSRALEYESTSKKGGWA